MEFWGVEVKAGEPLKVEPEDQCLIHVSQAAMGESKKDKGNEPVHVFVNIDGKKIVLGTLSPQNIPQMSLDLVFEKEFELSHNWKHGSVYLCGYQTPMPEEGGFSDDEFSDEDEDIPLVDAQNGEVKVADAKPVKPKANTVKSELAAKPKAKLVEPSKANKSEDESVEDDESDDDDETDEDAGSDEDDSDEGMPDKDSDEDDEDAESETDEETPKKAESSKKRPNESATKTPLSLKKAKPNTPQKSDGKKPGHTHTATPHPAKQGGKNATNGRKSQTPKSGGQFSCSPCNKSFGSDAALQSHSKAKHGGK